MKTSSQVTNKWVWPNDLAFHLKSANFISKELEKSLPKQEEERVLLFFAIVGFQKV